MKKMMLMLMVLCLMCSGTALADTPKFEDIPNRTGLKVRPVKFTVEFADIIGYTTDGGGCLS